MKLWLFHGFLGSPRDFSEIIGQLPLEIEVKSWDLHKLYDELKFQSKPELLQFFKEQAGQDPVVLCGYSMGGRIALELSAQLKGQVKGLLMYSSHMGLVKPEERFQRIERDKAWIQSFSEKSWQEAMGLWNDQPVFLHDSKEISADGQVSRESIEYFLSRFSLGKQPDFRSHLIEAQFPWQIVCGEKDEKFLKLWTDFCETNNKETHLKVENRVGHRNLRAGGHFLVEFINNL